MLSLQDLLKEGTKHLKGVDEATYQNIEAVRKLADILRTSFGPNGQKKLVINHLEKLFVTSDAATIIKELDIMHPAAKLAVLASQMQEQEVGDGTNLVLILTGELLGNAENLLQKGLHTNDIIEGYSKAAKESYDILSKLVVHECKNLRDIKEVARCLKAIMSAKQNGYEDLLSELVARACIEVVPKNPAHFNVDNVRVAKILGGGVLDTQVLKGHVLTRDAEGTIKHVRNAKVAVFSAGIEAAKTETKDTVLISSPDELINYNKSEEKMMEKIVDDISGAGINVVVSGGAVSEMAMHFLERAHIMVVKVPSKFELRRVAKAVGATPLVRLGAPSAEETGHADYVGSEEIGSTKVTILRQDKEDTGISTIVIRASTNNLLDDFERAIDDGVNAYKQLGRDNRMVPGAGATEIEVAHRLQKFGDATSGLVQYAIKKFAEAFEVVPRTLAENAGLNATDVVSNLYAAHQKDNSISAGIDIEEGDVKDVTTLGIFDLLATKISAVKLATDAATTILRVDQIIMSKPAGGPKPPKQGPMDAD